jgi:predicted glutamate--cysteine ligase
LIEARLHQMISDPTLDPLVSSQFSAEELVAIADANEAAAARASLNAELRHWQDGWPILAHEWIEELYQEVWAIAKQQGFSCFLLPLKKILREGNEAQQWLQLHSLGLDSRTVMIQAIQNTAEREHALEAELCQPLGA